MVDSLGISEWLVLQALAGKTAATVASTAGAAAVDCTKLAPTMTLIRSAAAAQLRSRYRVETNAFMAISF
jgi:hypothetical protein